LPGGFTGTVNKMLADPSNSRAPNAMGKMSTLLTRERIPWEVFLSFMLIPLSSIMFPHMSIMCFTAKRVTAFKKTVVLYPLCIMAIWLPCCFLGALGPAQDKVREQVALRSEPFQEWFKHHGENEGHDATIAELQGALHVAVAAPAKITPATPRPQAAAIRKAAVDAEQVLTGVEHGTLAADDVVKTLYAIPDASVKVAWAKVANHNSDSVLLEMLKTYVPKLLAGILAAGIISAVMGSDCHQILGLSTMFTKDIFNYYGGGQRVGERGTVLMGRAFIVIANGIAYVIALSRPPIFELAVTYAFSGFAALAPMMIAALFWRRSTKWAILANTLWVAGWVIFMVYAGQHYHPNQHIWGNVLYISASGSLSFFGFTAVVPMTLGAAILVVLVSLITQPPTQATIDRYFSSRPSSARPAHGLPVGAAPAR
jgi:hypothetical protein